MQEIRFNGTYGMRLCETPTHLYIAPHPLLRPYIAHYTVCYPMEWPPSPFHRLSLVPDAGGCLLFQYDGRRFSQILWGATNQMVYVANGGYPELIQMFVEFRPGGLYHLLGGLMPEITNCRLHLQEVSKDLAQEFDTAFASSCNADAFFKLLDGIFLQRFRETSLPKLVSGAIVQIGAGQEPASIQELSVKLGYSQRHVNRVIHSCLGISAKSYIRVLRVNRAVALMQESGLHLTEIAHMAGFYDQAHFIHDFQLICGTAPSTYRKNLGAYYKEPYKLEGIFDE